MSFVRYIRAHPFSMMALCNIVGDLGYLGFAFASQGWVSLPKLGGALFTLAAHLILLAYGDDQMRRVAHESGVLSRATLGLRAFAQYVLGALPVRLCAFFKSKPIGVSFFMLSVNGVGLFMDAVRLSSSQTALVQSVLGGLIMSGCLIFSMADFVEGQRKADILLKIAPPILVAASASNVALAIATHNFFVVLSVLAFLLSNLASFYTKIDKKEPISAGI